ncbi:MAG: TonB-dependent receptor [Pseudomonadota bacterium]
MKRNFSLYSSLVTMIVAGAVTTTTVRAEDEQSDSSEVIEVRGQARLKGSAAASIAEKREHAYIADILGSEQMSRTGDSSAAAALKRVTGLTLVDGKFIYVRGLGERYSSVFTNGANLPSPDPTRRVVPLDLFPTSVVDSISVQKSYSPEMPGEFGGGGIDLRTQTIPQGFFAKFEVGTGTNSENSDDGLTYDGGDLDWAGVDDGTRGLPSNIQAALDSGRQIKENTIAFTDGFSQQQIEAFGRSFYNTYDVESTSIDPDFSIEGAIGDRYKLDNGLVLGYSTSVNYENEWSNQDSRTVDFKIDNTGLQAGDISNLSSTENRIKLNSFVSLGLQYEGTRLESNTIFIRDTSDTAEQSNGTSSDEDTAVRSTHLLFEQRELFTQQLQGTHYFESLNELEASWNMSLSKAERDAPDERSYDFFLDPSDGQFKFSDRADSNFRNFSTLDDETLDYGVDFAMPFALASDVDMTLKVGSKIVERERESEVLRFSYNSSTSDPVVSQFESLEDILSAENINSDLYELEDSTRPTDNYTAEHDIDAYYLSYDISAGQSLRFSGGARYEDSYQRVNTFALFNPDLEPVVAENDTQDWLPVFAVTYFLNDDMQLRFGYSETLSRPDFRELSEAPFTDPLTDRETVGNSELVSTNIQNLDIRWEYYTSSEELISVAVFYKEFDQPIEAIIEAGTESRRSFSNADSAENLGLEFEITKDLFFLGSVFQNFFVRSNVAFIDSEVTLNDSDSTTLTSKDRALQGQSDYVVNAVLGFDAPNGSSDFTLAYNVNGDRIFEVGTLGRPDKIEQPFHSLDFIGNYYFTENASLKLKVNNLLDQEIEIKQGDEVAQTITEGVGASLSFTMNF